MNTDKNTCFFFFSNGLAWFFYSFSINHISAGHAGSGAAEQMWMYKKPEIKLHSGQGNIPWMPIAT